MRVRFQKYRIMTYISMNVGHSNLNFDMEVNVIYRCHTSPAKLKNTSLKEKRATIYWPMHWKWSLTYIFMKVGHSDLNIEI